VGVISLDGLGLGYLVVVAVVLIHLLMLKLDLLG